MDNEPGEMRVDPSQCEAYGRGVVSLRTNQVGRFKMKTRDEDGAVVDDDEVDWTVLVMSEDWKEESEALMEYEGDGVYVCEYRIPEDFVGSFEVHVMLEGDHIGGSPFNTLMNVVIPRFKEQLITCSHIVLVRSKTMEEKY